MLGREELARLLDCCPPVGRLQVETALYTGLRISELLGLVWTDVDLDAGLIRVRAQLSRAHRGEPHDGSRRRRQPRSARSRCCLNLPTASSPTIGGRRSPRGTDWVFSTSRGTPYGVRNVARRVVRKAADDAGLNDAEDPPLRFHDLRHTFVSHLVVDHGLDIAQVSRILGHARIAITLDVYTHLFEVVELRSGGRDNVRTSG